MSRRACVICETQYNIFNAVRFFFTNNVENKIDIYLGENIAEYCEVIKETNLFDSVYVFCNDIDNNASKIQRFIYKVFLKKSLSDAVNNFDCDKKYRSIYVFSVTRFPSDMLFYNSKAEIFFVEDGTDSYIGRIYLDVNYSLKRKLLNWLLKRDVRRLIPKKVYLNNPQLVSGQVEYEVSPLIGNQLKNDELDRLLKKIFNYIPLAEDVNNRIYYLGQAFVYDGIMEEEVIENEIGEALHDYMGDVVYRKHPREESIYSGWEKIDYGKNMWELINRDYITDETILISSFSTALYTAKLLYDKEPWLIYTYKLYGDFFLEDRTETKGLNAGIAMMVDNLKKLYKNPDKIICVESVGEIIDIVSRIITDYKEKIE